MPWKANRSAPKRWQLGLTSNRRNRIAAERAGGAKSARKTTPRLFSAPNRETIFAQKLSRNIVGGMIHFESSLWHCWEKLPQAIRSGQAGAAGRTCIRTIQRKPRSLSRPWILWSRHAATPMHWRTLLTGAGLKSCSTSAPARRPIRSRLCQRFPRLRATIFDLPALSKITERYVRDAGMSERIRLIAGDYRSDPIPEDYDLIFLSNIIHGENSRERIRRSMGKLAANLKPGGRLVIKDHILDDSRANPPVGAIFSLLMLLTTAAALL